MSLLDLPGAAWLPAREGADPTAEAEDFRLLAEHYTGTATLSRLELASVALRALRSREYTLFQRGDIAYALMALLRVRPKMDPTDSEAQALARLSLANDSDKIVERMACLYSASSSGTDMYTTEDDMGARLWDVEPTCQVAGVCDDESLILDGCRGISIRWKNVPRVAYARKATFARILATLCARSAGIFVFVGALVWGLSTSEAFEDWTYRYYDFKPPPAMQWAGIVLTAIGLVILLASPWMVEHLYGGKVWDTTPWLVGFEGTLPLDEIEQTAFGNAIGRLQYAPSSSVFANRRPDERIGVEPGLAGIDLPPGHRLFTLVDTGSLTVTVFSARKPPSVALICGKEGGMLRTLLCSFDRERNAFVRQAVIRMETPAESISGLLGWVKLANA